MESPNAAAEPVPARPRHVVSRTARRIEPGLLHPPVGFLRNPTVWLFVIDVTVFVASTTLYLAGAIPRAAAAAIALLCLYCFYTVTHDAVHGTAHSDRRINVWMGRISAAAQGLTFPLFRIIHLQHHAFTNDPVRDPDFVIGRQPRWLLPLWTVVRLLHDNQFMLRRKLWAGRRRQLQEHVATVAIQIGLVAAGILAAGVEFVLWAWIGPVVVAGAVLELTVAWAVHYPHVSQHPLENTRMFRGRIWQVLMLNQNYHLVHHLWPRIPWFRCSKAAAAADAAVAEHAAKRR